MKQPPIKSLAKRVKTKLKSKKGFTLIEVLLYISGFSIMIFGITSFLGMFTDARIRSQVISEVEQQGANISYQITQMIRDSDSITSPTPGKQDSALILDFPGKLTIDLSDTVIQSHTDALYNLNSSRIEASNLSFQNLSREQTPGIITASFTLNHINPSGRRQYDYSKDFYLTASIRPNS